MGWYWHHGQVSPYTDQERREYGKRKAEEMRQKWHKTFVSRSTLLRVRGWTEQAVFHFLQNKRVDAGPIMAYRLKAVEKIEKSADFKAFMLENPKGKRSKLPKHPKKHWWDDCLAEPVPVEWRFTEGVCMYTAFCPHCSAPYQCFVSILDAVINGIANLCRICPACDKRFWMKISVKTTRIAYQLDR